MPLPLKIMVVAGLVSLACWWPIVIRMKRIPRSVGYRGGFLRRYKENFPSSPLPLFVRICSLVFYSALGFWI